MVALCHEWAGEFPLPLVVPFLGDHSALGGLLLCSHCTAGGDGAYHVSILHELGAAELAALFFLRLQSLKGAEEVLTIHHYPKSSKT